MRSPGAFAETWNQRDVQLYHLAAGGSATASQGHQRVLPTFTTRALECLLPAVLRRAGPGFDPSRARLLEHRLVLPAPVTAPRSVFHEGTITAVNRVGAAAVLGVRIRTLSPAGDLVAISEASFSEGAARCVEPARLPGRRPDATIPLAVDAQQALLYRLCLSNGGEAGTPALDDLVVYGAAVRAAVDAAFGGDCGQVRMCSARFNGRVRAGETMLLRLWADGSEVTGDVYVCDRHAPVLTELRLSRGMED